MGTTEEPRPQGDDQRKALEESEKQANRNQPENYKEEETAEKIVEIGRDLEDDPIKGIDPPDASKAPEGGGR